MYQKGECMFDSDIELNFETVCILFCNLLWYMGAYFYFHYTIFPSQTADISHNNAHEIVSEATLVAVLYISLLQYRQVFNIRRTLVGN